MMIAIRRATTSNAEILSELGKKTFIETFSKDNRPEDIEQYVAETFSAEKQAREIEDPTRWIAIAWSTDVAVGFFHLAKSQPDPSITGTNPIELLRLYVDSRWHGKGVAAALMDECIEIARKEGFQTLWLGVWEKNFRAQAFYKKFNFATVGSHIFKLGRDHQNDLIMARSIEHIISTKEKV
jgi:GNAT superfamily N-acetyltransferase